MQLKEMMWCKGFNEDIYGLLLCRNVLPYENVILNMLMDEVHVDLNVFGMLMPNKIMWNMDHTLIVTPKNSGLRLGKTKLLQ